MCLKRIIHIYLYENERPAHHAACKDMSIGDPKFIELTADVLISYFVK